MSKKEQQTGGQQQGGKKADAKGAEAKGKDKAAKKGGSNGAQTKPAITPRLRTLYNDEIVAKMREEFGYKNIMQVPRVEKIVLNMGVGDATQDPRLLDTAAEELAQIAGQKASIRAARRSIAGFKLREGNKIGCMCTLRGDRMYEFLDRLISVAIPRIRDFRGISPNAFDRQGNFTMGVKDQTIFPEVSPDDILKARGLNISIVFERTHDTKANRELLRHFGMPFRN